MRGYPKYIATKQDYINLLDDKETREQAIKDLYELMDSSPETVNRALELVDPEDPEKDWVMEEIPNPAPTWSFKGFKSKQDLLDTIAAYEEV
jgi:hypothetical protein